MSKQITSAILPDASPDFQDGVVHGYHDCAIDLVFIQFGYQIDTPAAQINKFVIKYPGKYSPDWYAGWLAGYQVRRELHECAQTSGPESTGNA